MVKAKPAAGHQESNLQACDRGNSPGNPHSLKRASDPDLFLSDEIRNDVPLQHQEELIMADDPIDPRQANIAMGLAVTRWRKLPDDPIGAKLDDPQEWVQEAALMNHFLPAHLAPLGYSFVAVMPNEFSVGITKVRQYAGLIYKHMIPVPVALSVHDLAESGAFKKAAEEHAGHSQSDLSTLAGNFVTFVGPAGGK
ncbi:MAG: hypothetical protein ABI837_14900 [Acidobacteriota bacterium]